MSIKTIMRYGYSRLDISNVPPGQGYDTSRCLDFSCSVALGGRGWPSSWFLLVTGVRACLVCRAQQGYRVQTVTSVQYVTCAANLWSTTASCSLSSGLVSK
jgi:hypothetical protein